MVKTNVSESDNKFLSKWKQTRQKGMFNHVIRVGGFFGVALFVIKSLTINKTTNFETIIFNFLTDLIISGVIFGFFTWYMSERKYRKLVGEKNIEKIKDGISFQQLISLNSKEACIRAIQLAVIFSVLSAAIGFLFATASFFTTSANAKAANLMDPLTYFDVIITLIFAYFIHKKSRVAIVAQLGIYTLAKSLEISEFGFSISLITTLIFLAIYSNGVRAIFNWHSNYKR